jgi:hypothetical protein
MGNCNVVMNLQVPYNVGNFLTSYKPVSFSKRTLLHGVSIAVNIHMADKPQKADDNEIGMILKWAHRIM